MNAPLDQNCRKDEHSCVSSKLNWKDSKDVISVKYLLKMLGMVVSGNLLQELIILLRNFYLVKLLFFMSYIQSN